MVSVKVVSLVRMLPSVSAMLARIGMTKVSIGVVPIVVGQKSVELPVQEETFV